MPAFSVSLCLCGYSSLEIESDFQLECALRRRPVSSRRSLEGHVSERVCIIEVELGSDINGSSAECSSRRTWSRMIEDVSGIHADGAFEVFADCETLG